MTKRNLHHAIGARTARCCVFALFAICLLIAATFAFTPDVQVYAAERVVDDYAKRPEEKPTFWLVDENGSWRAPLPNWSLEEVMRIVDSRSDPETATPWAIQSVVANGTAVDGIARLSIAIAINVADGFVRAPLGLREGVYIPTPEEEESGEARSGGFHYVGPGLCVLDVDRRTGEYVAIFQSSREDEKHSTSDAGRVADASAPDASSSTPTESADDEANAARVEALLRPNQYVLFLELSFAVETPGHNAAGYVAPKTLADDAEYRFVASFPPSLHSQLTLEVPTPDAEIVAVNGAAADSPIPMSEATSELKFRGLGRAGERVEFGWRRGVRRIDNPVETLATVYQVEDALIQVELDKLGTSYDATIPIRSFGGDADVFYLTLPPDAKLLPESVAALDPNGSPFDLVGVNVVDAIDGIELPSETNYNGSYVEIRLAKKTSNLSLRLKATAAASEIDQEQYRAPRQLAGFRLVNAQKQFGRVRVTKAQDSSFSLTPRFGVSTLQEASLEDGVEDYSFYSQPFLIAAEGYERETIVDVRPEYLLRIDAEEARLKTKLVYYVYGAKAQDFRINLNGWRFAGVTDPNNSLNRADIIPVNDRGELVLPLAKPTDGEIVLEVETTCPNEPKLLETPDANASATTEETKLSTCRVTLPNPVAARVEPAPLVVLPANDVGLVPDQSQIKGLVSKAARAVGVSLELPAESRQTPLYYQTRLATDSSAERVFVADVRKLDGEVCVNVRTDVSVNEQGVFHVNQTMEYRVEYEPLASLEFELFTRLRKLLRDRTVKCFVDGRPQTLLFDADENALPDASQPTRDPSLSYAHVVVEPLRTGSHVVTLQYDLDPIIFESGATSSVRADFFQPKFASSEKNETSTRLANSLTFTAPVALEPTYAAQTKTKGKVANAADGKGADKSSDDDAPFQSFWRVEPRRYSDDGKNASITCSSNLNEYTARFAVSFDARDSETIIVDRAWIQSWFAANERVDRVVWRMTCDRDFIQVKLPTGVRLDRVAVAINSERLSIGGDSRHGLAFHDRTVRIPIDASLRGKEATFAIDYVVTLEAAERRGSNKGLRDRAQFPDFVVDSVWIRRVYWQLIFNHNRLVVVDPRAWTPEFVVKRGVGLGALLFRRVPTLSQDELCDWIGTPRREPIPQEANVYLYSRFAQTPSRYNDQNELKENETRNAPTLPTASFLVANNAFLVFLGSGFVLILGLALVYQQVMNVKQAFVARCALVVLCGVALLLASLRPLLTLLFLQTTAVGVFLTLVVASIYTRLGRNDARAAPVNQDPNSSNNGKGENLRTNLGELVTAARRE